MKSRIKPSYDDDGRMKNKDRVKKREYERLKEMVETLAPEYEAVADPLIESLAFQTVGMMELQHIIHTSKDGFTERYRNGATQYGKKESSEAKAYNSLSKTCTQTRSQLMSLVMKNVTPKAETEDKLMMFLGGRNGNVR